MSKNKIGVLLINLGTPDSPSVKDVRRYLRQFLNDPRVIDINPVGRFFLVNGIIVPFRAPKSAKIYKQLWTPEGSPLLIYGNKVKAKLQKALPQNYTVELAMRYQNPSLKSVLDKMQQQNYSNIILLPMFPQYASSSTGSAIEEAMRIINKWWVIPHIEIVNQFCDNDQFIDAFVEKGNMYSPKEYDHVLFSYHGLPERQVDKVYTDGKPCKDHNCEHEWNENNEYCYKAACYETTRRIAAKLGLDPSKYTVAFQSRLGRDPWIKPYSDFVLVDLAKSGVKKLLVFSPAFVSDCLETTIEIGEEYAHIFKENGGKKLQLVESLNDSDKWIECLKGMVVK